MKKDKNDLHIWQELITILWTDKLICYLSIVRINSILAWNVLNTSFTLVKCSSWRASIYSIQFLNTWILQKCATLIVHILILVFTLQWNEIFAHLNWVRIYVIFGLVRVSFTFYVELNLTFATWCIILLLIMIHIVYDFIGNVTLVYSTSSRGWY